MAKDKDCFYKDCDKGKKKKKKQKKYPKSDRVEHRGDYWLRRRGGYFALGHHHHDHEDSGGGDTGGGDGGGAMGESFIAELLNGVLPNSFSANVHTATQFGQNEMRPDKPRRKKSRLGGMTGEEDAEVGQVGVAGGGQGGNKIDQARQLFQAIINQPNMTRGDVIQRFQDQVGVTNSTAVSYYERLAKEAGLTNQDDRQDLGQGVDMGRQLMSTKPVEQLPADTDNNLEDMMGDFDNPDRAGVIRTVDNAHLIYKRQTEDGSFEELWIYNIGNSVNDELEIRRDILAGTDILPKSTKSPDGKQEYHLTTLGNAQYVNIHGLPN